MKKKLAIAVIFGCVLIIGCRRQLFMPVSSNSHEQEELVHGRKLYVMHCGGCHNLYLPKENKADEWKKNLDEMQERAKITDQEKELIFRFLTYKQ